jgi:hypothetical protein
MPNYTVIRALAVVQYLEIAKDTQKSKYCHMSAESWNCKVIRDNYLYLRFSQW